MLISASTPVEIPASEAIVYDSWVIKQMIFVGEGITRPAQARIIFQRGKRTEDGIWKLSVDPSHQVTLNIDDIYEEAGKDPEIAEAVVKFLAAIDKVGKSKGVI
jgi:hypothetical protein